MKLRNSCCFTVWLLCSLTSISLYSQRSNEKILVVENGLFPTLQIADSNYNAMSIGERMKQLKIRGVSVAVINNYELDWAKGYGIADLSTNTSVTTSTLFLAGSISKSLNALGVLKLADKNKIELTTDINTYLKTWKFPYDSISKGKKITVANLLSHTAGLSVHGFPGYIPGDSIPTLSQVLDGEKPANTAAVRSLFEPSLKFKYSGGGTTISQLIVGDVTSRPYEEYMQAEVLKPLGMSNSTFKQPYENGKWEKLSSGYRSDGSQVKNRFPVYPEMGAAGLWTNPTDLSKFIIEMQMAYRGESSKVLSRDMNRRMLSPYIDTNAAFGVFVQTKGNKKIFGHGGADEGFRAQYFGSLEDGYGAVVMVNSDNGSIIPEIMNSITAAYKWPQYSLVNKRTVVKLPEDSLRRFAGKYHFDDGDSIDVLYHNGVLEVVLEKDKPVRAWFTDNRSFFTFQYPYKMRFEDDKGEIVFHFLGDRLYVGRKKKI